MANIYRNILTVFGPLDEADRFVGRFVPGGMEAVMPIPADAKPNRRYSEIWGSVPDGLDLEVLTENSIVAVEVGNAARPRIRDISGNWVNYNTFTLADMHKEIAANDLPGFVGGEPRAVLVFHTKWLMPIRWIEFVINTEYDHGLSFHMQGYDVMANSGAHRQTESGECISECNHDHGYTSTTESAFVTSGHCAVATRRIRESHFVTFEEINNGDGGDYLYLPDVDDEGSELPAHSGLNAVLDIAG